MMFKIINCQIAPLHFAVQNENIEIVKLLLENSDIDVNCHENISTKFLFNIILHQNSFIKFYDFNVFL